MVTFDVNLNDKGYGSIPQELRRQWGRRLEITPNDVVGVIYKKGTELEDILDSMDIVRAQIEGKLKRLERDKK